MISNSPVRLLYSIPSIKYPLPALSSLSNDTPKELASFSKSEKSKEVLELKSVFVSSMEELD